MRIFVKIEAVRKVWLNNCTKTALLRDLEEEEKLMIIE